MFTPTVPSSTHDLVEQFLDAKLAAGLSARTVGTYRQRLGYFLAWVGDREITRMNLRGYLTYLQEQQISGTSRASYFRDVAVFCGWLVTEKIWDANPAYKLGPKAPKRRPANYSFSQVDQLLEVCDARDRAIVVVLLDTGLRAGELCTLNRHGIDWDTGAFTVIGKGDKERAGWLGPYAQEILCQYLDRRHDRNPAVFTGTKGRLTPRGVHKMLHRRAQEAGIRDSVRRLIHSFRVSFAVSYIKQGGDIESLRQLLGHEDISMSAYYAQLNDEELAAKKATINPLGQFLTDPRSLT